MVSLGLPAVHPRGLTLRFYLRAFARLLDAETQAAGQRVWLEKTPRHLYFIPTIERTLKDAKFIHVLRDGADVVASLHEVTQQHPEIWGGSRSVDTCIARWRKDVELSEDYRDRKNHLLMRYEDVSENPEALVQQMVEFIGLPFDRTMLDGHTRAAERVVTPGEVWKRSVSGRVERRSGEKLHRLFSSGERAYILERTRLRRDA